MTLNEVIPVVTQTPAAALLALTFDVDRMRADLARLTTHQWKLQRRSGAGDVETEVDWRVLSLRSVGGVRERTDPGGPGLEEFADTSWLELAPYLADVLSRIPAQLRSARLMALGPGADSGEHYDYKYGPAWGTARLHVPITTTPGATLVLDGVLQQWRPGALWFGDFTRVHRVRNTDAVPRVHLVVDTLVSRELIELFPPEHRAQLDEGAVLVNRMPVPLEPAALGGYAVRFQVPASFLDWTEEDGDFLREQPRIDVAIGVDGSRLVLQVDGKPIITLIHIGDGEFRFAGWTDERTIQLTRVGGTLRITLRTRVGATVRALQVSGGDLHV